MYMDRVVIVIFCHLSVQTANPHFITFIFSFFLPKDNSNADKISYKKVKRYLSKNNVLSAFEYFFIQAYILLPPSHSITFDLLHLKDSIVL